MAIKITDEFDDLANFQAIRFQQVNFYKTESFTNDSLSSTIKVKRKIQKLWKL